MANHCSWQANKQNITIQKMIKSNFNTEYHAPKCKVIALTLGTPCLNSTSPNGVEKAEEEEYGDY